MSTVSPAKSYEEVLELFQHLSFEDQLGLIRDISSGLLKHIPAQSNAKKKRKPKPFSARGKYKHVRIK
jgi:hypothetical protein